MLLCATSVNIICPFEAFTSSHMSCKAFISFEKILCSMSLQIFTEFIKNEEHAGKTFFFHQNSVNLLINADSIQLHHRLELTSCRQFWIGFRKKSRLSRSCFSSRIQNPAISYPACSASFFKRRICFRIFSLPFFNNLNCF